MAYFNFIKEIFPIRQESIFNFDLKLWSLNLSHQTICPLYSVIRNQFTFISLSSISQYYFFLNICIILWYLILNYQKNSIIDHLGKICNTDNHYINYPLLSCFKIKLMISNFLNYIVLIYSSLKFNCKFFLKFQLQDKLY